MADYTELVKRLRERSVFLFPHHGESRSYDADIMHEAADAIEELQGAVSGYEATTDVEFVKEDGHERIRFVPKWIPVTERLPEPGVPCLCWCRGGTYGQIRWFGLYYLTSHRTWAIYDNDYEKQEVTHWMYRPEPPKEET